MEQPITTNDWHRYHFSLKGKEGKRFQKEIERVLDISQSAFYRKIKYPHRFLSIAEKQAIARIYNLEETYLFPELATEAAAEPDNQDAVAEQ